MNEAKFFGALLPFLPEFQPILKNIREKYGIPEISPDQDGITEITLADHEINWDNVRKDIDLQVRSNPDLLPKELAAFLPFRDQQNLPDDPDIYEPISDEFRIKINFLYTFYVQTIKFLSPIMGVIDRYYEALTN